MRIGSGLSFADYIWIRQKPWKEWDPKHPPAFLLTAKRGQDDKGEVYLEPEECVDQFRLCLYGLYTDCTQLLHYQGEGG